ncbi:MAG: hypothetical protein IJ213_07665 [Bacteroidales bacterium]|nr:hypothetical protein [Bacteroidales bacterium]
MKTKKIKICSLIIAFVLTGSLFISCEDNEKGKQLSYCVKDYTDCKKDMQNNLNKEVEESNHSEYSLKGNVLTIMRMNYYYNCCDDVLKLSVEMKDDKIIISELGENACNCICQRSATYEITNIPKGHYTVIVNGSDKTFEIDVK